MQMLQTTALPQLHRLNEHIFFQQDGAPAHFAVRVRRLLDAELPNRWIGRQGSVDWPARSPDLTPMDFFFWGVFKDSVFSQSPRTVADLRRLISECCQQMDNNKALRKRVCRSLRPELELLSYFSMLIQSFNLFIKCVP